MTVSKKISELNDAGALSGAELVAVVDFDASGTVKRTRRTTTQAIASLGGADGTDGANAFIYIAYASDAAGTGFTTTFNAALDYIAILATDTEIASPAVGDFAGLWKNYKGADGAGAVESVNGLTGVVVLDPDDLDDTSTTNKFTSAAEISKLAGIETAADVTDATNVNAAGAVMESDFNAQTILIAVADNTPLPVTIGASTFVGRKASGDAGTMSAAEARTVLNVEDGATADQSAAEILAALLTVDGPGSLLDADTLDGNSAAAFAAASHTHAVADLSDATANGRSLISAADYAAMRTLLGLVIGTNVQAFDADLTTWAGLTPSANAQSLVTAADYAAMRGLLDLEAGTDFLSPAAIAAAYQPLAAVLTATTASFLTADETKLDGIEALADVTDATNVAAAGAAMLATADQTVAGGARITTLDDGTKSSGTYTPDPGDRPMIKIINGGAFTLAPGTNVGAYLLDITNNASAGAITTSGWTKVVGAFTTTNGHKFRCHASIGETGSLLVIQAMQ